MDPFNPVDLNVTPEEFLSTYALLLQNKSGPGPQKLAEQTDRFVTAIWGDLMVDNFQIAAQRKLARGLPNAFGDFGLRPGISMGFANSNSVALQAALDRGAFYVPSGEYEFSTSLIYRNGSNMFTDGRGKVNFYYSGGGAFIRPEVNTPSPISSNRTGEVKLSGFNLTGPGAGVAGSVGIDVSQTNHSELIDINVTGFETPMRRVGYGYYSKFRSMTLDGGAVGCDITQGANSNNFYDVKFTGSDIGAWIHQIDAMDPTDGTNQWNFFGCWFEGLNDYHLKMEALTDQGIRGINTWGCRHESANTSYAYYANALVDQFFIYSAYYSNLMPGLNQISMSRDRWLEIRAAGLSHLSVFDDTDMVQLVNMIYRSAEEKVHFCKTANPNPANYVNTVGANHICSGAGSRLESAEWDASRGTTLTNANFTLSAKWGDAPTLTLLGNPKKSAGKIRIIPGGNGILANPTVVITFPHNFGAIPVFSVTTNPAVAVAPSEAVDAVTLQFNYTPTAGTAIDIRWHAVGAG